MLAGEELRHPLLPWAPTPPASDLTHQVPQAHASLVRPRVGRAEGHAKTLLCTCQAGLLAVHDDGATAERGQKTAGLYGLGLVQLGNLGRELVNPDRCAGQVQAAEGQVMRSQ